MKYLKLALLCVCLPMLAMACEGPQGKYTARDMMDWLCDWAEGE